MRQNLVDGSHRLAIRHPRAVRRRRRRLPVPVPGSRYGSRLYGQASRRPLLPNRIHLLQRSLPDRIRLTQRSLPSRIHLPQRGERAEAEAEVAVTACWGWRRRG